MSEDTRDRRYNAGCSSLTQVGKTCEQRGLPWYTWCRICQGWSK